ncbi:MAG: dUTP diphosphatase [Lachnospiraceae bacterium]|nr:dUTP diphosphatase [Lachnospiraceae bacterium]
MKIEIITLSESAKLPERGSDMAAGYDLFADITEDIIIDPHTTAMVGTGIAVAIPEGYFGGIFARSGLSSKEGLRPANCTGVVDADYRGEVKVALHNDSDFERIITPGQKVAQMVIMPFLSVEFDLVDDLDSTDRGEGGFGSTGKM